MSVSILLTDLPDEVLHSILLHCNAPEAFALERCCNRFRAVTNDSQIWKLYCQRSFRFWDDRHDFRSKLRDSTFTAWKHLYRIRWKSNDQTRDALDRLIREEFARLAKVQNIVDVGYDAKDVLKAGFDMAHTYPDHLARRYWCHAALGSLQRSVGLRQWDKLSLRSGDNVLERALAAFDMFVLAEAEQGDIDDIFDRLDQYAEYVRVAYPDIETFSPREKAVKVAQVLLEHNLVGIRDGRDYYSLDHMFLGVSLFSSNRNSIPLVSAVIYCHVARKFGLRAAPVSFPFHVHALVNPPDGLDLDGYPLSEEPRKDDHLVDPRTHLYMDPFNVATPVEISGLEESLRYITNSGTDEVLLSYLRAASPVDIVLRSELNILQSENNFSGRPLHPINRTLSMYAGLFAGIMIRARSQHRQQRQQIHHRLNMLHQHCFEYFELDLNLIIDYLLPISAQMPDGSAYRAFVHSLKLSDELRKPPKPRSDMETQIVKYRVGQVFRHRLRDYVAVIYGWDPACEMHEQWINLNHVDRLNQGRYQPFYNVLVTDESTRYVAQENVIIMTPSEITDDVLNSFPIEIGKFFKRYDPRVGEFVSNITDEYPDG